MPTQNTVSTPTRKRNLPDWMKIIWLLTSPLVVIFGLRIGWEKTVWTWTRGPQMVGFSLFHLHPGFAIIGLLCSLALMAWLGIAFVFCIFRRYRLTVGEAAMLGCAVVVTIAVVLPDGFFAR